MTAPQPQTKYRKDYQPPQFLIDSIDLDFQLDDTQTRVSAVSRVRRNGEHQQPLVLDGQGLELAEVLLNGQSFTEYQLKPDQLELSSLPDEFELTITTIIDPLNNSALEGLYKSGEAFCTQCEAEGFRRITYFLDRPDILSRYRVRITADKTLYPALLSNGNRIDSGELADGKHWVQWEDPFPKPSYLFALVAGDFDLLEDSFSTRSGRKVALEIYVDKGNRDRAFHAMESLKKSMRWDEERFDLEYDLDIYMIVAVDFFNMGAMENKGLNVFNSKFVLANAKTATDNDYHGIERVIAHEYFHNWTGNRVTCRDWFQLSLKEGLTVFRDQEFSSDVGSRAYNRILNVRLMRSRQFAEDASPMAHPIRPDAVIEMSNFYTVTVYEKGSEVIRMMHTLLGEENFQAGMRLYFERFDGQAVTCDDFVQAMQDASGIDLGQFSRWYSQSGTPVLTVRDSYDEASGVYRLHIAQHTPATQDQSDKQPLHIPFNLELYNSRGEPQPFRINGQSVSHILNVTETEQEFEFEGLSEQPIPSLLREFSAPVKLDYPYSNQQLALLMRHATDLFSRWDAAQMLVAKQLKSNLERYRQEQALELPDEVISAFASVLEDESLDPMLKAEILRLSDESSMAELFDEVDVDGIHRVRCFIKQRLAEVLLPRFTQLMGTLNRDEAYQINHQAIGERSLKAVCLSYIACADKELGQELVERLYKGADNMTDTMMALSVANGEQLECRNVLMADFEKAWSHDPLVMDQWFALQALSPAPEVIDSITSLFEHPVFSLKNPNRVRALIGVFSASNPLHFHRIDGAGYKLLAQVIRELNTLNPQVAARLITPLIQFKRYDSQRAALMRSELEKLQQLESLAKDLYEKVSKALS
nr:aminopeptidase N [Dongshaea marina]